MDLKEYFNKLRHDKKFHLGLGDVRLTIGMQEEICTQWISVELLDELSMDMHNVSNRPCDTCKKISWAIGKPFGCYRSGQPLPAPPED